jgi:hypothetical protein
MAGGEEIRYFLLDRLKTEKSTNHAKPTIHHSVQFGVSEIGVQNRMYTRRETL